VITEKDEKSESTMKKKEDMTLEQIENLGSNRFESPMNMR